jgi:phosphonate transport system ATP-binding protein
VRQPHLLLGDEPFASLDPPQAHRLGGEFQDLVARNGLTVVLVLHHLGLARGLADRIIGLAHGQVEFDGPATGFSAAAEQAVFGTIEN